MKLDVVCIIDPRFTGGTAAAAACDIRAFLDLDLDVGVVEVSSSYLQGAPLARSKVIAELLEDSRILRLEAADTRVIEADTAFLHHPMTFFYGLDKPIQLNTRNAFLVAHHLPFRGDGSLQYDPVATTRRVQRSTGIKPTWAPVSGICRQQLQSFTPLIRLAAADWPNVFDVTHWNPSRKIFMGKHLTIGRHGRDDPLKWPETPAEIRASLPTLPDTNIRVMGAPTTYFRDTGVDVSDWTVLPFDGEPIAHFLDQLDVFIYHFHAQSSECYGRTVAEAMLMETVCILDPRLEPTFGTLALYGTPNETVGIIERLRNDPAGARELAARGRHALRTKQGLDSIPGRLGDFMSETITRPRSEARFASPLEVLRKTAGMIRRREYFPSQLGPRD